MNSLGADVHATVVLWDHHKLDRALDIVAPQARAGAKELLLLGTTIVRHFIPDVLAGSGLRWYAIEGARTSNGQDKLLAHCAAPKNEEGPEAYSARLAEARERLTSLVGQCIAEVAHRASVMAGHEVTYGDEHFHPVPANTGGTLWLPHCVAEVRRSQQ